MCSREVACGQRCVTWLGDLLLRAIGFRFHHRFRQRSLRRSSSQSEGDHHQRSHVCQADYPDQRVRLLCHDQSRAGILHGDRREPRLQEILVRAKPATANSTLSVDIALAVGSVNESVEVTAEAAALQTESATVQQEVTGTQVLDQELNGRNPIYMVQLLPGVRGNSNLGDLNFTSTGGQGWQINGARTWDTLITFDGAPAVRTRANGAVIGSADVDSTAEIQVLTADYAAEYGRAAGGQIRIVTKSGTRDFHGSLYEYFRNSDLNANTWQRNLSSTTNFTTPFRYNNFGFTIGGPIIPKGKWQIIYSLIDLFRRVIFGYFFKV